PLARARAARRGSRSTAPVRKHTAPTRVPRLDSSAFLRSPVAGTMYAATAETPNATEPSRLARAIHQLRGLGSPSVMLCRVSTQAYPLATRNAIDPKASGRHTRWSAAAALRLMRSALPVLQLNHRVPVSCTAQATHGRSGGAHTQK